MKLEEIKKAAVIGSGAMGSQITEVLSRLAEYEVRMVDVSDELVNKGIQSIGDRMERFFVAKGKMTAEEKKAAMGRIKGSTSVEEAVRDVDFVLEAVPEIMTLKRDTFIKLDENAPWESDPFGAFLFVIARVPPRVPHGCRIRLRFRTRG